MNFVTAEEMLESAGNKKFKPDENSEEFAAWALKK